MSEEEKTPLEKLDEWMDSKGAVLTDYEMSSSDADGKIYVSSSKKLLDENFIKNAFGIIDDIEKTKQGIAMANADGKSWARSLSAYNDWEYSSEQPEQPPYPGSSNAEYIEIQQEVVEARNAAVTRLILSIISAYLENHVINFPHEADTGIGWHTHDEATGAPIVHDAHGGAHMAEAPGTGT